MNKYVVTVANSAIDKNLNDFIKSIRFHGWDGKILIYSPEKDKPSIKDSNSTILTQKSWWSVKKLKSVSNTPALLKPLFLSDDNMKDGDLVLYLDSADLLVFCNLDEVFDQIPEGKVLGAKKYLKKPMSVKVPSVVQKDIGVSPSKRCSKGVNSGVILASICEESRVAGQRWADMLQYIPKTGAWFKASGKVGDQVAFNQVFGELEENGLTFFIPKTYNYHRWSKLKKLKLKDGKVYTKSNKEVKIIHGSGKGNIPPNIRKYIRGA